METREGTTPEGVGTFKGKGNRWPGSELWDASRAAYEAIVEIAWTPDNETRHPESGGWIDELAASIGEYAGQVCALYDSIVRGNRSPEWDTIKACGDPQNEWEVIGEAKDLLPSAMHEANERSREAAVQFMQVLEDRIKTLCEGYRAEIAAESVEEMTRRFVVLQFAKVELEPGEPAGKAEVSVASTVVYDDLSQVAGAIARGDLPSGWAGGKA